MPLQTEYNKDTIKESILNKLLRYYGCTIEDATPKQIYAAVASTVRDQIMLKWRFEKEARRSEKAKRLYYLSIEFLTGRWLHNNLLNLCSTKEYEQAFEELGLTLRGCRVTLLAPDTPFDDIAALGPDGVLLSDGPERLTPTEGALQTARALLQSGLPLYGVDAGHQLLAVAAGCRLEPLPAGHRGPNHPVHETGGATFTTTQRHGLTVVPESVDPARAAVTHVNRNDGSVEGLRYAGCPAFSTQYLPDHRGDSTGRADAIGAFLSAMAQRKEGGLNA